MPDFLLRVVELLEGSTWIQLAVPAVLFTVLLLLAKGPPALRLSDATVRSVRVTMALLLINGLLAPYLVLYAHLGTSPWGKIGLPHLNASFWEPLPWPITILFVMILIDFVDYWTHRVMHGSLLWGIHAIHHSEQRMTWVSTSRIHFLEASIMNLGYVVLLGWTGLPLWAIAAAIAIGKLHNRYVHCDLGWNHGPLAKVVVSPNLHRWHHSVEPVAFNQNFANMFAAFDVLFGTYYNPGKCETEVGASDFPNPGVLNQMVYPFTFMYRRITKDLAALKRRPTDTQSKQPLVNA